MKENKNTYLNDESEIAPILNHPVKGEENTTLDEGEKTAVIPDGTVIIEGTDPDYIVIPKNNDAHSVEDSLIPSPSKIQPTSTTVVEESKTP